VVNLIIARTYLYRSEIGCYLLLLVKVNAARLNTVQLNKGTIIWLIETTLSSLFRAGWWFSTAKLLQFLI
jgi:hypothetical protein